MGNNTSLYFIVCSNYLLGLPIQLTLISRGQNGTVVAIINSVVQKLQFLNNFFIKITRFAGQLTGLLNKSNTEIEHQKI
jgi:hypothetical protein